MPHALPPDGSQGGSDDAWSPRAADPGPPPLVLPGYRDFVLVATGGDSLVYRAIQDGVTRPVAVKVLVGGAEGEPAVRYQRELEITVRVGRAHPNIVTVLDTQVLPDGRPCIVMEYYELGSLHDQLRAHGPMPSSAVVAAGTVVADALGYAHREGVLHRDVKPQNILVLPTSYVLADFGLARRIDAGHTSSLERFSYRHASPQVLDGELPTVADDIYSLGSTLFTLLDGRPPFAADEPESDSALAYLRRARSELPRPIRSSDAPPELLAIIDRCLAKRREDRFPDAMTLRDALRAVVTEAPVWARAWQPQSIRGREAVSAAPPRPTSPDPVAPASPGRPMPAARTAPPESEDPTDPVSAPLPASGRAPARHGTADPPTPRVVTPAPLAALIPGGPVDLPGPATGPQPVVVDPVRPRFAEDGYEGSGRDDRRDGRRPGPAWARVLLLTVVALVLGTGLGLGGSYLLALLAPGGGVQKVPLLSGSVPSDAITGALNQALAPEILEMHLSDAGDSVELVWDDPTDGRASFVINQIGEDGDNNYVLSANPGITRTAVVPPDPDAAQYCFQVVAISVDTGEWGVSDARCTQR